MLAINLFSKLLIINHLKPAFSNWQKYDGKREYTGINKEWQIIRIERCISVQYRRQYERNYEYEYFTQTLSRRYKYCMRAQWKSQEGRFIEQPRIVKLQPFMIIHN